MPHNLILLRNHSDYERKWGNISERHFIFMHAFLPTIQSASFDLAERVAQIIGSHLDWLAVIAIHKHKEEENSFDKTKKTCWEMSWFIEL